MSKKNNFANMSTKKKSRKLFLGVLVPLLIVTIVACTFFYNVSETILTYYINAQLQISLETLNSSIMENVEPITVNLENFVNFAKLGDGRDDVLEPLIKTLMKTLKNTSSFYYISTTPISQGGRFIHSEGWEIPETFDVSSREWYTEAIKNDGKPAFSNPYATADSENGDYVITISQAVKNASGKIIGVVGCDVYLEKLVSELKEIQISKRSKISLINQDGFYMTNEDVQRVMKKKWIDETTYKGDKKEWMNGEMKTLVKGRNFYGISKIGSSPWFIVIEGPKMDFTGSLSNTIVVFEAILILFSIFASIMNINTIRKMRLGEQELGKNLFEETQNLVVSAKENAATAQDQSAAVKEIVATMEDSNALSESIAAKIKDVSKVSEKTSSDVANGVSSIEKNVAQLHAIFDANQQTIEGMKVLSERIESIWDIVTLINNVADQAKIIAFNAELEASSAGEAGKSFRIVANEIRRLSDGIIDGTKEIKEKINEIQHSSDSLILASESGTEKINAGYENAKSLAERFASIKDSAEITAASAGDITEIIQQQTSSSEQVLIALKQISSGVENFTVATDNISASSEHIRAMSEQLNNSVKSSTNEKK
ncbi:MAG: hypothetical protein II563_07200 [Treponema sp.]|nr:hypothetical protein [Treponema sp.]